MKIITFTGSRYALCLSRYRLSFPALILFALISAVPFAFAQEVAPSLPDSLGDWKGVGEAQEFVGDDLFLYMNGGAEIYHEAWAKPRNSSATICSFT